MTFHRYIVKLVFVFIFVLSFHHAPAQSAGDKPNFIIVMTDDQGYGDVGYMGNPEIKTPNLDDMAKSGLRLDRFYTAPVCSPTRAAVMTGRYPNRAGVFSWGHALRPQEQSIAKVLKSNGYRTGFFGKYHLGSIRADGKTSPGAHGFETWYAAPNFYENDPWMSHNGKPVQLIGESSDVTVDLALAYIENAVKQGAPFVVFVWLGSPHLPHEALEELTSLYPDQPENMKHYYGEITGIDRSVGKLRKQLRAWDIAEETVLWFSSDNGGKFPEGSNGILRGEKGTLWEGGIRVPALVEWPGVITPKASDMPTAAVDIFPTLLELAGLDPGKITYPLDGTSLVPLMKGRMKKRGKPLGFWNYAEIKGQSMKSDQIVQEYQAILNGNGSVESLNEGLLNTPDREYPGLNEYPYAGSFAWIDNQWKLHQKGSEYQLYNLEMDPREEDNLAGKYPNRVSAMKNDLMDWQNAVIKSIRGGDY